MAERRHNKQQLQKRQQEAQERQEQSSLLSPQQRLQKLDQLLGPGVGAAKERKRLLALIDAAAAKK